MIRDPAWAWDWDYPSRNGLHRDITPRIEVESHVGMGSTFRVFFRHVSAQKESVPA